MFHHTRAPGRIKLDPQQSRDQELLDITGDSLDSKSLLNQCINKIQTETSMKKRGEKTYLKVPYFTKAVQKSRYQCFLTTISVSVLTDNYPQAFLLLLAKV